MAECSRTEETYRYEQRRAISAGIIETAGTTFLLLIVLRWFRAGPSAKAFVAAGGSLGLLLSPLVVVWTTRARVKTSRAASWIVAFGAIMFLVAAVWPVLPVYVICTVAAMASSAAIIPLLTQMYQEN